MGEDVRYESQTSCLLSRQNVRVCVREDIRIMCRRTVSRRAYALTGISPFVEGQGVSSAEDMLCACFDSTITLTSGSNGCCNSPGVCNSFLSFDWARVNAILDSVLGQDLMVSLRQHPALMRGESMCSQPRCIDIMGRHCEMENQQDYGM